MFRKAQNKIQDPAKLKRLVSDLLARDKISLDLFWLKDDSLLDSDNLPDPDVIAAEIADDLRSALEQMEAILADLDPALADPLP